ncbi:MAG: FAD-dependent oxidoreductase [Gammaproteobacteria bacterium]|nr:FAD-dependent oxidoreductase [Gammaproteobacteria bacterium]
MPSSRSVANPGRRRLLKFAALAGASGVLASHGLQARGLKTSAHIVIIGAGAGGMAMANRLSRSLDGARISLVDEREIHHYQPGWTLVASGV